MPALVQLAPSPPAGAAVPPVRPSPPPERARVPDSALVPIGRADRPGAITLRVRRGMPLRHGLMLALATAVMALGILSSQRHPIRRAIIVLPPALQDAVVT